MKLLQGAASLSVTVGNRIQVLGFSVSQCMSEVCRLSGNGLFIWDIIVLGIWNISLTVCLQNQDIHSFFQLWILLLKTKACDSIMKPTIQKKWLYISTVLHPQTNYSTAPDINMDLKFSPKLLQLFGVEEIVQQLRAFIALAKVLNLSWVRFSTLRWYTIYTHLRIIFKMLMR